MTQTLDVQATKTTVTVDGEPFHVYEYHNDQYIDIVIRTDRGNRIDHRHSKFEAIGIAYTDSTEE
jgi:hypothetical protein